MGAITTEGRVLNTSVVQGFGISHEEIEAVAGRELQELLRREDRYRMGRPPVHLQGKTVILIDDGLATGATMRAAVMSIKAQHPAKVIVAVPAAPADIAGLFAPWIDEYIAILQPEQFYGVAQCYADFPQCSDNEVVDLLEALSPQALKEGV
jgi:predicted phosphoribosyltransferase